MSDSAEPTHSHKNKCSLSSQDSTEDHIKIRFTLNCLKVLLANEDLDVIEDTVERFAMILEFVHECAPALENITKKKRVTFSRVSLNDLKMAGVQGRHVATEITNLTKKLTMDAEVQVQVLDLHSRIKEIYACVNMDCESGSYMILDTILLAVRKIVSTQQRDIAIIRDMRQDEVQISHPVSGYELSLAGKIDYAVIEYENVSDHKSRLVDIGGSRVQSFQFAKGHLLVVLAKYPTFVESIITCIPEAVGQAIALLKSAKLPEVHFCLSDGEKWIFFILKSENNTLTYYESGVYRLSKQSVENSDLPLCEIVQLVCEWLRPTVTGLFE